MSDMDSNTDSGAGGVAASQTSGEGAKLNSIDAEKIAAEVLKLVEPVIKKEVQSVKDKRFAEVDDIKIKQDKILEKLGITPEDAKAVGLFVPSDSKSEPVQDKLSGKEVDSGAIAEKILNIAGLESDDPDVTAFKQRAFKDDNEKVKEAIALVARKQSNPPAPKAPPEVNTKAPPDLDAKLKELTDYMNKPGIHDPVVVKKLQEEINQLKQ